MFGSGWREVGKNPSILFDMSPLGDKIQKHLVRVYLSTTAAAVATTIGAYAVATGYFSYTFCLWGGLALGLGSMFGVMSMKGTTPARLALFILFGFAEGLTIGPAVTMYTFLDPSIVLTAAVLALGAFVSFSAVALLSKRREWLFLGGMLSSVLTGLFFLSVLRLFFNLQFLDTVRSFVGLALFSLYVVFDTQVAVERATRSPEPDFLRDAISLHLDLVNLFMELLRILGKNSGKNKKEKERK